jgi:hypothetical protein
MPKSDDNPDLKMKKSSAKDLKEQFEEIVVTMVNDILTLTNGHDLDLESLQPEIQRTVNSLTDAVSNTMLLDPH